MSSGRKVLGWTALLSGTGLGLYVILTKDVHTYKEIKPDDPAALPAIPSTGKTGYKLVDKILDKLRAAAIASGIPLGLLVGWIAKESGGKLEDTTSLDERGYFQLMPDESKMIGADHERLSTDSDYSIAEGIKLVQHYATVVSALNVAPAGSSYFWRMVKLAHSMGSGQVKKIVTAAKADDSAGDWNSLEEYALGMHVTGPQPKKWFAFVDSVYGIGAPFGFGSSSANVGWRSRVSGLDLLGAESV